MNDRKCHILIVDDNIQDFKLMSVMIRAESDVDYEFYWAKNSEEAKDALNKYFVDLVAVDYRLGSECGTEVIEDLRKQYPNLAYIMITGMEDPDLYKEGLAVGASSFLLKSAESGLLFDRTVQFAIEHKRVQNNLQAANESKNRLMSLLSHDLGDPLESLVNSLAVVRMQANSLSKDELVEILDASYRSAYEAMNSTNNIIGWGKDEKGRMRPNFKMVNMTDIVSGVFNLLATEAKKKCVTLSFHGDCGVKAYVDERMLATVLRNLVANALENSGVDQKVEVHTRIVKSEMIISITDCGTGIPSDDIASLKTMQRKMNVNEVGNKGYRDGLEICWHMLELLGSDLQVDSEVGQGSTFSFILPISLPKTDMEPDEVADETIMGYMERAKIMSAKSQGW